MARNIPKGKRVSPVISMLLPYPVVEFLLHKNQISLLHNQRAACRTAKN